MGKSKKKRNVDICIISDIHLGTHGCQAEELLAYLKTIHPKKLILNGDIIDIWNFKKNYFPKAHMEVIRRILKLLEKGSKIVYITGNHDETLRKFSDFQLGDFHLVDKYVFRAGGKSHWAFHGDVFDSTTKGYAKIIAKLGGKGYDMLIVFNRLVNDFLKFMGREKMSLSKKIKNSVKGAVKFIDNFEKTAAELAIEEGYDYVICGHIHQPQMEKITTEHGSVTYLNSGDWIENLTALEFHHNTWKIVHYDKTMKEQASSLDEEEREQKMSDAEIMRSIDKLLQD